MNGASDLIIQVFGADIGLHARTVIGCSSLPFNGKTVVAGDIMNDCINNIFH